MSDFWLFVMLFFGGAIAGFINMMAGGGSILTIGAMILFGVEPQVANATNRIGVLTGTISGATAYKTEKFTDLKTSLLLAACAIPGAVIGAFYSISISNEQFQKALAVVMILILVSMFLPKHKKEKESKITKYAIYPVMVAIGFYGGFIQVGVGLILMAAFRHLMAYDLLRVNMHKVFVVLIYTIPVLVIFGISGKINWVLAIALSAGNSIGCWVSVKLSLRKGEKFVRIVLVAVVSLMAVKFLFF